MSDDVISLPYTRVLERALGWMTLPEVREIVDRVRERGGFVSAGLDQDELAQAHPDRVHAILQGQTPGHKPFFEIRVWNTARRRSFGEPIDLTPEEVRSFPSQPAPIYHELVAPMDRGRLTE